MNSKQKLSAGEDQFLGRRNLWTASHKSPWILYGGFHNHGPAALPRERNQVPIVQEAGWTPRAGLDGCEKSRRHPLPTGKRSPDRQPITTSYTDYVTAAHWNLKLKLRAYVYKFPFNDTNSVLKTQIFLTILKDTLKLTEVLKNERPTWYHLLFYFNSYVFNMFRTLIYPSSEACDCVVELPHRSSCSQFVVCWRFGATGFEWCSFCRLKPAKRTPPKISSDDGYINVRNMLSTYEMK